jgi:hypothetical protein
LASFILLEASHAAEDFEAALPILATLLAPHQHRLPPQLESALEDAQQACASSDARRASKALTAVLRLASELRLD